MVCALRNVFLQDAAAKESLVLVEFVTVKTSAVETFKNDSFPLSSKVLFIIAIIIFLLPKYS